MVILVDYDNVDRSIRMKGLQYLVDRIASLLTGDRILPRLHIRLYGGWYSEQSLTRAAEKLAADVQLYPEAFRPIGKSDASSASLVTVELAYSTLAEPTVLLFGTYRQKACPENVRCQPSAMTCCPHGETCGIRHLPKLLDSRACPGAGCSLLLNDLIFRGEQKLVDVMMASDLLFLGARRDDVAVVSSDHDLWPAIRQVVATGSSLLHILSKKNQPPPLYYVPTSKGYRTMNLCEVD